MTIEELEQTNIWLRDGIQSLIYRFIEETGKFPDIEIIHRTVSFGGNDKEVESILVKVSTVVR